MFNIWKLGNAFLQNGRPSLICCDVRYCWKQVQNIVNNDEKSSKATDLQSDKQLKFKQCSYSEPASPIPPVHLTEPSLLFSTINAADILDPKAPDDYDPYFESNNPLALAEDASDFSFEEVLDLVDACDIHRGGMELIQPDTYKDDPILYFARRAFDHDQANYSSETQRSQCINEKGNFKDDDDNSYIINIFLNNRKASDKDSVNVCLKDLEIKADDICMQKLMKNIQKNYATIDRICQSSENFEECKTKLSKRLEKVWSNVFRNSKLESDADLNKDMGMDEENIGRNRTSDQAQNRVNIIVNYNESEKALKEDERNSIAENECISISDVAPQEEQNVQTANEDENLATPIDAKSQMNQRASNTTRESAQLDDKNLREEAKNDDSCELANTVKPPPPEKITNEYIRKKLEIVEDKIAVLKQVNEAIAREIKDEYMKIKEEEKQLAKIDLLANKEKEMEECIDSPENETEKEKNVVQVQASNTKATEINATEESVEAKEDCETKVINATKEMEGTHEEKIKIEEDEKAESVSNIIDDKECIAKEENEDKSEKKPAIQENYSADTSAVASELVNKNNLNSVATQLQNNKDTFKAVLPTESLVQATQPVLIQNSPVREYKAPPKTVSNKTDRALLDNFIIKEHLSRNASRKSARRVKENQIIPQKVCFRKDCDKKYNKILKSEAKVIPQKVSFRNENDKKDNKILKAKEKVKTMKQAQPKFQIREPPCLTSSVFKRTDDRLHRYNDKQQEQMDSIIKMATTPVSEGAVTRMMRFCRNFFKEGDKPSCPNTPAKNKQQEDYIDRRMRATKLNRNDNPTFKMQYRSFMPDNPSETPPDPVKSDTELDTPKPEIRGSMNRTEDVLKHQKIFQDKCGIRERMLPSSGGNSFNRNQKRPYRTNVSEASTSNKRKNPFSLKQRILKILRDHRRYYSSKDDCHKDDECCEKSKVAAEGKCVEEDPCGKPEKCEEKPEDVCSKLQHIRKCESKSEEADPCEKPDKCEEKHEDVCAKMQQIRKCESKSQKADICGELEKKYKKSQLKSCAPPSCKPRDDEEDDDGCGGPKYKCETPEEMKKIRAGVLGCTSKCVVNRDPDDVADPEPIQEPCPKLNDCDPRQKSVVEPVIPKCNIMDQIGKFMETEGTDEVENYYTDNGYKNTEYYKNKPFTYYDINEYLTSRRNPQPNPFGDSTPKKTETKRKTKRKLKKSTCPC